MAGGKHIPDPDVLKLQNWATGKWLAQISVLEVETDLTPALQSIVSQGAEYAKNGLGLEFAKGEAIRVILTGIAKSESHEVSVLEKALGVPFPPEARYK